jgi:hypothetical protein
MLIVQLAPAPKVLPHPPLTIWKSPVTLSDDSAIATPPVFATVTFCTADFPPTVTVPKLTEGGVSTTAPAAAPVPLSAAVACPPATLAEIVSTPVSDPIAVGAYLTCTVQLPPAAIGDPTQSFVCEKSSVAATPDTTSAALPLFVAVIVCAPLADPTACVSNASAAGVSVIAADVPGAAVNSGICQIPLPYVAARNSPFDPPPAGVVAEATSCTTGAFGSPLPYTLQQFALAQLVT